MKRPGHTEGRPTHFNASHNCTIAMWRPGISINTYVWLRSIAVAVSGGGQPRGVSIMPKIFVYRYKNTRWRTPRTACERYVAVSEADVDKSSPN